MLLLLWRWKIIISRSCLCSRHTLLGFHYFCLTSFRSPMMRMTFIRTSTHRGCSGGATRLEWIEWSRQITRRKNSNKKTGVSFLMKDCKKDGTMFFVQQPINCLPAKAHTWVTHSICRQCWIRSACTDLRASLSADKSMRPYSYSLVGRLIWSYTICIWHITRHTKIWKELLI